MASENFSYIHTPERVEYEYVTIPERLSFLADRFGDKKVYTFLTPDGRKDTITAKGVYEKSHALASSLMKLGIGKGDIVATCLFNELDVLLSTFGVICAGAIVTNLGVRNEDGSDLQNTIRTLGIKCIIINPGNDDQRFKACTNFIDEIGKDGSVVCKNLQSLKWLISTETVVGNDLLLLKDMYETPDFTFCLPRLDPESVMVLFTTSGSSGEPKFVPRTHHETMIIANNLKEGLDFDSDDVIYNERRISWVGGFPFMFLLNAVKVITKTQPFSSLTEHCEFTYRTIVEEKCTHAGLLPATIVGLLDTVGKTSTKPDFLLKNIHVGGLPVSAKCMDAIGTLTEMVTVTYGSTEGGFFTYNPVTKKEDYVHYSSGRPHSGFELKVVDEDGFVVKSGGIGTIYVRSPCLIHSYYDNEVKTKEVITPNHWMNTDDVGYMTSDGQLVVNGRKSDIILQAGRYMIPSRIEGVIKTHPDVFDALVVSVPDDSLFETVCACVLPIPGRKLTPEIIEEYYTKGVLPFAQEAFSRDTIEHVVILDKFPTLSVGKPDKAALKRIAMETIRGHV